MHHVVLCFLALVLILVSHFNGAMLPTSPHVKALQTNILPCKNVRRCHATGDSGRERDGEKAKITPGGVEAIRVVDENGNTHAYP